MSGYGPLGFSQTLAYLAEATSNVRRTGRVVGDRGVVTNREGRNQKQKIRPINYLIYLTLRLVLAVDLSLVSMPPGRKTYSWIRLEGIRIWSLYSQCHFAPGVRAVRCLYSHAVWLRWLRF